MSSPWLKHPAPASGCAPVTTHVRDKYHVQHAVDSSTMVDMRFRRAKSPPPYLNKRDQLRLLAMVGLFALILAAMEFAARPSSWYWLTGTPDGQSRDVPPAASRSEKADEHMPSSGAIKRKTQNSKANQTIQIDPDRLKDVKDNTLGIRRVEKDAYDYLLAQARDAAPGVLEHAALRNVDFTVLMLDADRFRGQPITVDGQLRRLMPFTAASNRYSLTDLYEAWIFTSVSGTNPYRIICTNIPAGLPQGMSLDPPPHVRTTGFFFKRYSYAAGEDRFHTAPLLLANSLRWFPAEAASHQTSLPTGFVLAGLLFLGIAVGMMAWRISRANRALHDKHQSRPLADASPEAIRALDDLDVIDPAEALRQLSESNAAGPEDPIQVVTSD